MRLTFFGIQILHIDVDIHLGPVRSDEPAFEPYQDAGSIGSDRISGEHNGWEKHPNGYDEPGEGDEQASKVGFTGIRFPVTPG